MLFKKMELKKQAVIDYQKNSDLAKNQIELFFIIY